MFADLAKKYFSTYAQTDYKENQKGEIKKAKEIEKIEKDREKEERRKFLKQLTEYPRQLKVLENELNDLYCQLKDKYEQADLVYEDLDDLLKRISDCKMRIKKQVLKKPARFALSESQEKKLYDYRIVFEKVFDEKIAVSDELVIKTREKLEDFDLLKNFNSRYKQCKNYLSNLFDEYKDRIEKSTDSLKNVIGDEKNKVLTSLQNEFERLKPQSIKREIISNSLVQLESFFEDIKEKKEEQVGSFLKHIESLNLDIDEDVLTGYYKLQYEEIVKKWNQTKELAQLGITVEIIDHQFNALYSQVALSIKELKQYMDKDKGCLLYTSPSPRDTR